MALFVVWLVGGNRLRGISGARATPVVIPLLVSLPDILLILPSRAGIRPASSS